MRKNGKRNYFIIVLFLIVALLAVGYALFAESLSITGTATATGTFDLEFLTATVTSSSKAGMPTATISGDKNALTLAADTLLEPGANVLYTVEIKNVGSVDAELTGVTINGDNDSDIDVTINPTPTTGTTVASGATHTFTIEVKWLPSSSTGGKSINYSVTLDYEQAT